ncbi:hypothetical protein KSP40_PGU006228 [Platanthera guangdongensis]|uniref:Uncharacterized protein n=1 Tax=Platanthera guangdongensis TaxID=2320717 RepID=A0ABR2M4R5_9ASPA
MDTSRVSHERNVSSPSHGVAPTATTGGIQLGSPTSYGTKNRRHSTFPSHALPFFSLGQVFRLFAFSRVKREEDDTDLEMLGQDRGHVLLILTVAGVWGGAVPHRRRNRYRDEGHLRSA